mmetsp:Transcript_122536/g.392119  ORF Transcript_122536/g.392119 Transcript_122536/m.392119 type:complete len:109 (-) Transcript_122536:193-519(-)
MDSVFATYGRVEDIYIMKGRSDTTGQSAAFVTYSSLRSAQSAVSAMDTGYEIRPGEGNIIVKYADMRPKDRDGGKGGKGDRDGGKGGGKGGGGKDRDGGRGGDRSRPY